jgi:hypothetical protein
MTNQDITDGIWKIVEKVGVCMLTTRFFISTSGLVVASVAIWLVWLRPAPVDLKIRLAPRPAFQLFCDLPYASF